MVSSVVTSYGNITNTNALNDMALSLARSARARTCLPAGREFTEKKFLG